MEWFFDGVGTMLIGLVFGGAIGGTAGWHLAIKSNKQRQTQRAGKSSTQMQVGRDSNSGCGQ